MLLSELSFFGSLNHFPSCVPISHHPKDVIQDLCRHAHELAKNSALTLAAQAKVAHVICMGHFLIVKSVLRLPALRLTLPLTLLSVTLRLATFYSAVAIRDLTHHCALISFVIFRHIFAFLYFGSPIIFFRHWGPDVQGLHLCATTRERSTATSARHQIGWSSSLCLLLAISSSH